MDKLIIYLGLVITALGLILRHCPQLVNWFGKLPGDISYKGENTSFFMPITSMIVLSVVISLLLRFFSGK